MRKLIYDFGVNDLPYPTQLTGYVDGKRKIVWICPFYDKWISAMERCYSPAFLNRSPWYRDCSFVDDWKFSSRFKSWMETQDWQGKQLDKDLLLKGNKIYGPDTCCFLDQKVNTFLIEGSKQNNDLPLGVYFDSRRNKFMARCRDGKIQKFLGYFKTANEAHEAWLSFKLQQAKILASEQSDMRIAKALIERYENYLPS